MADSRLLHLATHDASPGSINPDGYAGFDVDLTNIVPQVHDCIGFSVESVGFYNLAPNVSAGSNTLLLSVGGYLGGAAFTVVVPTGNYDSTTFPVALQAAISAATGAAVTITGSVGVDGRLTLNIIAPPLNEFEVWAEGAVASVYAPGFEGRVGDSLATIMGFYGGGLAKVYASDTFVLTAPGHIDLGGERVAFLHSSFLVHDKSSFDGEGLTISSFASLPIVVPYEVFNLVYPNQYQKTIVDWGRAHDVRNINLRLRNIRGELLNVQGTQWFAVLRLYLADQN